MPDRVRPIGDHVLIRVRAKPEKTASGIILPERMGREDTGEVLAIGSRVGAPFPEKTPASLTDGSYFRGPPVSPGDVVRFDPYKVRLVIDEATGYDATGSVHAKGGQLAIIPESAILWVEDGAS